MSFRSPGLEADEGRETVAGSVRMSCIAAATVGGTSLNTAFPKTVLLLTRILRDT